MNQFKNFFLRPSRYSLDQPEAPQFVDSDFIQISNIKEYPDNAETILESDDFLLLNAEWASARPGQDHDVSEMFYGTIQISAVPKDGLIYYIGYIYQLLDHAREIIGKSRFPLKGGELYNLNYRGWHEEISVYCNLIQQYTVEDLQGNPGDVFVHSDFYPDLWSWLVEDLSNHNE